MPLQNPVTRIEQVAIDLGRLADDLGDYLGAQRTFLYLQAELVGALDELQRANGSREPDVAGAAR